MKGTPGSGSKKASKEGVKTVKGEKKKAPQERAEAKQEEERRKVEEERKDPRNVDWVDVGTDSSETVRNILWMIFRNRFTVIGDVEPGGLTAVFLKSCHNLLSR